MEFVQRHLDKLQGLELVATGTTGRMIMEATGLEVTTVLSGPLGGDQQIGGMVARRYSGSDFLRDPHSPAP